MGSKSEFGRITSCRLGMQQRITTPVICGQENSNVEVLINPATRSWRGEVVDHAFNTVEAEVIKSIPLSSSSHADTLIWPFTPSGQY